MTKKLNQRNVSHALASSKQAPPAPFRPAPATFDEFLPYLSKSHVYITHLDDHPVSFKEQVFAVPVLMNLALVLGLGFWWLYIQLPWYLNLISSSFAGVKNATTVVAHESTYATLAAVVVTRALWFMLDLALATYVLPWPLAFFIGRSEDAGASPIAWRWMVAFREREIVVRQSRPQWDSRILAQPADEQIAAGQNVEVRNGGGVVKKPQKPDWLQPEGDGALARAELLGRVKEAIEPRLIREKTGYVTMDTHWDLSWNAMIGAHKLVDKKDIAIEAFKLAVFVHHPLHGWLALDLEEKKTPQMSNDEIQERREQEVRRFREGLKRIGKEDLFFRWIELVQYESTRPGGFTQERQQNLERLIRDLFTARGVDFDQFWKATVGESVRQTSEDPNAQTQ